MDFSPESLIVGLVLSSIGFVALVYGKRQQRFPHMVAGLLLLVFPYFVPGALLTAGIGVGIIVLWIVAVRAGL